jgi:16S rRNA A1518/A1519 N6-dimethyltransferase RsmA/KsgA/DIM1 with predicted DNA glycosylase/AP lyase activity
MHKPTALWLSDLALLSRYAFVEGDDDSAENELQFSKNVVVVEITGGPGDLTLIDLPGIIRNTEKEEDQRYIGEIQELVRAYTKKENTIIVATVTCTDDIDNQVAPAHCQACGLVGR